MGLVSITKNGFPPSGATDLSLAAVEVPFVTGAFGRGGAAEASEPEPEPEPLPLSCTFASMAALASRIPASVRLLTPFA